MGSPKPSDEGWAYLSVVSACLPRLGAAVQNDSKSKWMEVDVWIITICLASGNKFF